MCVCVSVRERDLYMCILVVIDELYKALRAHGRRGAVQLLLSVTRVWCQTPEKQGKVITCIISALARSVCTLLSLALSQVGDRET